MIEIKTLKNINCIEAFKCHECGCVHKFINLEKELKKEVTNHIKFLEKLSDDSSSGMLKAKIEYAQDWIQYFFNMTDSDMWYQRTHTEDLK